MLTKVAHMRVSLEAGKSGSSGEEPVDRVARFFLAIFTKTEKYTN
jgi:hypothetical protein